MTRERSLSEFDFHLRSWIPSPLEPGGASCDPQTRKELLDGWVVKCATPAWLLDHAESTRKCCRVAPVSFSTNFRILKPSSIVLPGLLAMILAEPDQIRRSSQDGTSNFWLYVDSEA